LRPIDREKTPLFSLIIATLGRTTELEKLLASIAAQERKDIEIIIVDQNDDARLDPILATIPQSIGVTRLRVAERNVSRARNLGMDAAKGKVLAWPDDDCWYSPGLLDQVDNFFQRHSKYSVFSVGARDEEGISSGNRWIQDSCEITPFNSLRTTFCSSLFISDVVACRATRFDEALNRGEETDFVLRLLRAGLKGRFEKKFYIGHPRRDMLSGTVSVERAKSYGSGMGALARRHSLLLLWACLFSYDIARAILVFFSGRRESARFCFAHAQGLFQGFLTTS
jgi:glycosyltransferase involved in cell wall biosynthesis